MISPLQSSANQRPRRRRVDRPSTSESQTSGLTKGFLPISAFRRLDPTAVGVVDLDVSVVPRSPDGGRAGNGERDCLLLVRLHGEPLAVVHVGCDLASAGEDELAIALWHQTGAEIRRHVARFRCAATPADSGALVGGLRSPTSGCPGGRTVDGGASVAVILCTVGREERLARCVRSLLAQRGPDVELVVVDNRPESGEVLRTLAAIGLDDPRVRYVPEHRVGLSVARNRGVSETAADLVAFTDDDVIADPSWLRWLVAPFADPSVTATSGMVLPLELRTKAQKRFEQFGGFFKGVERRSYDLQTGRAQQRLLYPFLGDVFGSGNSMAFRRADLIAAGGFDPALGTGSPAGGGEDMYALSTAILRGGRIVYEPRALCWHEHRCDDEALRRQVFSYGTGFTATMTKALADTPRFYLAVARAVPHALALARRRRAEVGGAAEAFPQELTREHRRGLVRGPLRYAEGVMRARRLHLGDVIRGN